MKHAWRTQVVVLVVSVVSVFACSTTQPDRITTRTASLSFAASALVDILDCYEVWQDTDDNGIADLSLNFTQCNSVPNPPSPTTKKTKSVPWRYSLSVSRIREGTTSEEIVTSLSGVIGSSVQPREDPAIDDYISLTGYDPDAPPVPDTIDVPTGNFLINGKRVSLGSPIYLAANGFDVGTPGVLGPETTFDFNIDSGDTVVVRARKQPYSLAPTFLRFDQEPDLVISAFLSIGGQVVATRGSTISPVSDGGGVSFSFTVQ